VDKKGQTPKTARRDPKMKPAETAALLKETSPPSESDDEGSEMEASLGRNMMRMNLGPAAAKPRTRTRPRLESLHRAYGFKTKIPYSPNVCYTCQTIPFDELPDEREPALPHHLWHDLLRSTSPCRLCRIIFWAAQKIRDDLVATVKKQGEKIEYLWDGGYLSGNVPGIDANTRVYLYGSWSYLEERALPFDSLLGLGVRLGPDQGTTGLRPEQAYGLVKSTNPFKGSFVRILTDEAAPMSILVPGRMRERSQNIPEKAEMIKRWLKKCKGSHSHCTGDDPPLPDRVLKVYDRNGFNLGVRLIETRDSGIESERYICLSYKWGMGPTAMTTNKTYRRLKKGVDIKYLPATFSQAAMLANCLNVEYIWIDSICVLQDDDDDWAEQTSKMAEIYGNAYLTIAAAASTDCHDGLFRYGDTIYESPEAYGKGLRDTTWLTRPTAVVRLSNGDGSVLYFYPEEIAPIPHRRKRTVRDPLRFNHQMSRAWALQERILSPRVVHMAEDQLYWECLEGLESEDGLQCLPVRPRIGSPGYVGDWDEGLSKLWMTLVQDYSRRLMANETDRLVAISGIASRFADIVDDVYDAGVWRRQKWSNLLWRLPPQSEWKALGYSLVELYDSSEEDSTETESETETEGGEPGVEPKEDIRANRKAFLTGSWQRLVQPVSLRYRRRPLIRHLKNDPDFVWQETSKLLTYQAPSWSWASLNGFVQFVEPMDKILATCRDVQVFLKGSVESGIIGNVYNRFGEVDGGWMKLHVSRLLSVMSLRILTIAGTIRSTHESAGRPSAA
jgi:hypothetical protein